ncbi:hypothetical protein N431DRAFT_438241 [Stipitochalara longipes BDJ]|nr:hypothetical protein N431DRAFT_438241 [Stipitochalara longipes BDJ]
MTSYSSTNSTSSLLSPSITSSKQKYIKTSIGGAGNFLPSSTLSTSTSPPSSRRPSSTTTGIFHTGIGGFGNRANISEQGAMVVKGIDVRAERESWHVGIGGAGNRRSSSVVSEGEESGEVRSGADRMRERVFGYFVR